LLFVAHVDNEVEATLRVLPDWVAVEYEMASNVDGPWEQRSGVEDNLMHDFIPIGQEALGMFLVPVNTLIARFEDHVTQRMVLFRFQ
jgi:hypothetical protein